MKRHLSFLVVILSLVFCSILASCNRQMGPFVPVVPTPTATPTTTFTPTATSTASWVPTFYITGTPTATPNIRGVYFNGSVWPQGPIAMANAQIMVNGAPETTASGTVSGPGGSFPLSYNNTSQGYAYYNTPSNIGNFTPGQTYTMTLLTSLGTVTATAVAPGGSFAITPNGQTVSWAYNGNQDSLLVMGPYGYSYESWDYFANINSGFTMPSWAYPGAGTYYVQITMNETTYAVTGANTGSQFLILNYGGFQVNK